jgi:hypothetical protein
LRPDYRRRLELTPAVGANADAAPPMERKLLFLAAVAALASFLGADFPASSRLAHSLPRHRCQQQVNAE